MSKDDLQDISDFRGIQIICFIILLIMLGVLFYMIDATSKKNTDVTIATIFIGSVCIGFLTGIIGLVESAIHEHQAKTVRTKELSERTRLTILLVIYFIILLPASWLLSNNLVLSIGLAVLGGVSTPAFIIMFAEIIDVSHEHITKSKNKKKGKIVGIIPKRISEMKLNAD